MDRLQFFVDWYNREEERKASVENSLNIPIGVLTLLFAMQFFLVKEFDFNNSKGWQQFALLINIALSSASALAAGFYLFKSYHNFPNEYKYGGIPYASKLLSYEKDLINFYKENREHFNQVDGRDKFREYFESKLAEHIDTNAFINDEKYRFLNICKRLMFLAIITLVISFVPFLMNFFNRAPKPQQVEIINLDSLNLRLDGIEYYLKLDHNENANKRTTGTTDTATTTTGQTN